MRKIMVAGNWKMNLIKEEAVDLSFEIKEGNNTDVLIAPTYVSLEAVSDTVKDKKIYLAGQNMCSEDKGAYTSQISAGMLKDVGCSHVILGHSEVRAYLGETDENLNKKIASAKENKINAILCIGESLEERESGITNEKLGTQLEKALEGNENLSEEGCEIIIAYEPIWAIGTGKVASPEQVQETHNFIRQKLGEIFDQSVSENARILYGGSVKPANAEELLNLDDVDGVLVGGASLKAESFNEIIEIADKV